MARGRTLGQFNFLHAIHDEPSDVLARTAIADQVQRAVMKVNSIRIDLALGGRLIAWVINELQRFSFLNSVVDSLDELAIRPVVLLGRNA